MYTILSTILSTDIHIFAHTYLHANMCTYVYMYMYLYIYMCIYEHISYSFRNIQGVFAKICALCIQGSSLCSYTYFPQPNTLYINKYHC